MSALHILQEYGLNITKARMDILSLFLAYKMPMNGALIKAHLLEMDRVTLYRVLKAFTEKGILCILPSTNGVILYALKTVMADLPNAVNKMHFVCTDCKALVDLEKTVLPEMKLPPGFIVENMELVISGKCRQCSCSN